MTDDPRRPAFVDGAILKKVKRWRDYVDAKLGFRNHWYPVLFSDELLEGRPVAARLCGENLLLNRIDGKVHAMRDRCLHRGVKLSVKPKCHTKDTITCWYHGFTYRFDTGALTGVLAAPASKVGTMGHRIRTFAVEEAKGLVFVFMGERDGDVPPLSRDVPPGFLDEDLYVRGQKMEIASNWRHGVENGFDSTHILIHRESLLIKENELMLPLGFVPTEQRAYDVHDNTDGGPIGIIEHYDRTQPVWEGTIEGKPVLKGTSTGSKICPATISMWMPCALKVDPWPDPTVTQFEWYVPVDEKTHLYVQTLGTRATTPEERTAFDRDFHQRWKPYALDDFNGDDVWAREATEEAYADDMNWIEECLFEADHNIMEWRELASKRNGGVQTRQHLRE